VEKPDLLFARLEDKEIDALRIRFSGTQKERKDAADALAGAPAPTPAEIAGRFRAQVDLRVAKIVEIKRHPDAEKLYVETVDLGTETRTIVSGLVPHYKEEELLGRNVVLVANLKPAMLRGVESRGMLLAAQEARVVEVLFVDHARPGDRVTLAGGAPGGVPAGGAPGAAASLEAPAVPVPAEIDIDTFFSMPIAVESFRVTVGDSALECAGKPIVTAKVAKGRVK
jgi:methionyl-tRNA synthetase